MEIQLKVTDNEIWDDEIKADLVKVIYKKFPNALWEKQNKGYKILIY